MQNGGRDITWCVLINAECRMQNAEFKMQNGGKDTTWCVLKGTKWVMVRPLEWVVGYQWRGELFGDGECFECVDFCLV